MIRKLVTIILSVTVLWLLATISAPVSLGQDFGPLFPPSQQVPARQPRILPSAPSDRIYLPAPESSPTPVEVQKVPSSDPAHGDIVGSECPETHWLVSVRHCEQCRQCARCCDLDFFRADWQCCTSRSTQAEFSTGLRPGVPVCIVVHGSYVTRETVKEDCERTFHWLRDAAPHLPLHVVFFTWPSEGPFSLDAGNALTSPVPGLDVAILGRRAEMNGARLARLINVIPKENPISLVGHSHGARVVASALHLLGGGQLQDIAVPRSEPHRLRTVLAAAAIDHDWLNSRQRYGQAMCSTECLLNMQTRHDWALWFYPLRRPFSSRSLGRVGFTGRDLQALGGRESRVAQVDVSDFIGTGHIWPHYYNSPEIARAMLPYVYFAE